MTITVLDIATIEPLQEGEVEATRFLTADTVGAQGVEGTAYRVPPHRKLAPLREPGRYQLFYVTAGRPVALYGGARHELAAGCGVYCDRGEACGFDNPADTAAAFYRFVI